MLWAEFKPQPEAELAIIGLGALFAGVVSGSIPFSTGIATRQTALGIICGILAAGPGALFGCIGGLPAPLFLALIIYVGAQPTKPAPAAVLSAAQDDYDELARPFQLPGSKDEPTGGWSDFDRDRQHV